MSTHGLLLCAIAVTLLSVISAKSTECATSPKPDFKAPGRRISEEKCLEYNWERKNIEKCSKDDALTKYPYMGVLGFKDKDSGKQRFLCSAFLISPKFALTVGQCLKSEFGDPDIVRFGNSDISADVPRVDAKIIRTIAHPDFKPPKKAFDIGLVELETPLTLTRSVQPACLWSRVSLEGIDYATAPGWGTSRSEDGSRITVNVIREMKVQLVDSATCKELVKDKHFRHWLQLEDHQICANETVSGVRLCQGSSGVPLVTPSKVADGDEMPHAFALTSFGFACSAGTTSTAVDLGFYTNVASFIDWIEKIVWPSA